MFSMTHVFNAFRENLIIKHVDGQPVIRKYHGDDHVNVFFSSDGQKLRYNADQINNFNILNVANMEV